MTHVWEGWHERRPSLVRLQRALRLHKRDACPVSIWGIEAMPCLDCLRLSVAIDDATKAVTP